MPGPRIAIIGAGLSGLTCACVLAASGEVSVFYDRPPLETTSSAAIAIWHTYLVDPTETRVLRWSAVTLARLLDIASTCPAAGVYPLRGLELFRTGPAVEPAWAALPPHFRMLDAAEVAQFPGVVWGYEMETPLAEMAHYLPWLHDQARLAGVRFERRRLRSPSEVPPEVDVVVNCAGLGARELVGDFALEGVRGQYLVLRLPEHPPRLFVEDEQHPRGMSQMFPRRDGICVGGTEEHGVEELVFDADVQELLERAADTSPWLRDVSSAEIQSRVVGVRPYRASGVRLERGRLADGRTIIHNYGHGGAGYSLAWGCAADVAALLNSPAPA